ncbi:methanogen output domain 1-containing protein [Pyruvatibacter mobilis]|nr:methanogen output domain 1-containing protein [Pyruvatibacter mobilis]GGD08058.1 transcriptional regulator [Pyruvatibacter mobilis]
MALQTVNVARMGDELPDAAPIGLSKENFLVQLLTNWSQTLEDVAGLEEASGMISVVGGMIGLQINQEYRQHFGRDLMDRELVAQVLVDLKRRIDGGFSIERITDEAIVLVNSKCPFGSSVNGRTSLCMMTSNVFGKIAAENLGYARIELAETIASGDGRCRVIVHLRPSDSASEIDGREYFSEQPL